ncbi:hypothetical protein E2320_011297, partial [Naja naja]
MSILAGFFFVKVLDTVLEAKSPPLTPVEKEPRTSPLFTKLHIIFIGSSAFLILIIVVILTYR